MPHLIVQAMVSRCSIEVDQRTQRMTNAIAKLQERHDLHMQNDTWTSIGTSTPIWIPQVKDGDILSRWTPLTRRWHQMVLRGLLRQMVGCGERLT